MARAATTGAYSVAVSLRPDACPGVFALHDAADGALARVRLPGGAIDAAALQVVAGCAEDLGDGAVHLTSRGNVQLRGLRRDDPRLAARLAAAGLLPSTTHERARNVLASPLSGIAGGLADVRDLARELDRGLCARPALAALSGRFLFALDDGRGDVVHEDPDLCWQAVAPDDGRLLVAGEPVARVPRPRAVTALLDAAEEFLAGADGAWRTRPAAHGTAPAAGDTSPPDASGGGRPASQPGRRSAGWPGAGRWCARRCSARCPRRSCACSRPPRRARSSRRGARSCCPARGPGRTRSSPPPGSWSTPRRRCRW